MPTQKASGRAPTSRSDGHPRSIDVDGSRGRLARGERCHRIAGRGERQAARQRARPVRAIGAGVAVLVTLCGVKATARAQGPDSANAVRSGVYQTAADFVADRLAWGGACGEAGHRVEQSAWGDRRYVVVTHDGRRVRLATRDLYGMRACDGRVVRFAEGDAYTVLGSGRVILYTREVTAPAASGKGFAAQAAYFFSRTPADVIRSLTRAALKDAFPDDHGLHERLDLWFRSDADLREFDGRHGRYRLLHVLEQAPAERHERPGEVAPTQHRSAGSHRRAGSLTAPPGAMGASWLHQERWALPDAPASRALVNAPVRWHPAAAPWCPPRYRPVTLPSRAARSLGHRRSRTAHRR